MKSSTISIPPGRLGLLPMLLFGAAISAGCATGATSDQAANTELAGTARGQMQTAVASTVEVQVGLTVEALQEAPLATRTQPATANPSAIPTATQTSEPLRVGVTVNTNCRSGPAANYDYRAVLLAGETAEVLASSTVEHYWLIENPDLPGESCWLWDEYAELQGDPSGLPRYTPEPSPTPALDFVLFVNSIRECGSDRYVHLTLQNTGGKAFVSGRITVVDLSDGGRLYGPLVDRHPFAAFPGCPPDHGNYVGPGAAAYISIPIEFSASGHYARATIRACTHDYAGGDCVSKTIDFLIP